VQKNNVSASDVLELIEKKFEDLHKGLIRDNEIFNMIENKIGTLSNTLLKRLDRNTRILEKKLKLSEKLDLDVTSLLQKIEVKVEHLEETFLCIFHNIKKNQFLYSHYPDDWVKEYLDIKEGLKFENKFLDKKIEEKTES